MRGLLIAAGVSAMLMMASVHPAAASEPNPAATAARFCPNISYAGKHYPVRVKKGGVSCSRARKVLRHFFVAIDRSFAGWRCFYGHGTDTWAGTCIRGSERSPRVFIRAYNPVD